jgi:cobalt-zinc-cadmium efflux system protein
MKSHVCFGRCSSTSESAALDRQTQRILWLGLLLVGGYSMLEFAMGWYNHSLSLLADAAHMVSDSVAFGSSLLAFWLARQPQDSSASTHQRSYRQAGSLAAFANGIGLLISALWIGWEAISRFQANDWAMETTHALVVTAMLGLLINGIIVALLHRPGQHDLNIKGVFWHVATDLLSSMSVLVAAGAIAWWHWWWMDTVVSLAVATVVLFGGLSLIWDSVQTLLGRSPQSLQTIQASLQAFDDVVAIADLTLETTPQNHLTLHANLVVTSTDPQERDRLVQKLRSHLQTNFGISTITVQLSTPGSINSVIAHLPGSGWLGQSTLGI